MGQRALEGLKKVGRQQEAGCSATQKEDKKTQQTSKALKGIFFTNDRFAVAAQKVPPASQPGQSTSSAASSVKLHLGVNPSGWVARSHVENLSNVAMDTSAIVLLLSTELCPSQMDQEEVPPTPQFPRQSPL